MPYESQIGKKLLDVQRAGRESAEQNRPSSNATAPDEVEVSLLNEAHGYVLNVKTEFDQSVAEVQKNTRDLGQKCSDLEVNLEQLLSDDTMTAVAQQRLAQQQAELVRLKVDDLQKLASLKSFKHDHKITREPSYPGDRVHHFALIVIATVVEVFVNAAFFRNEAGFVGGSMVALSVAAINIGGAVWLGHLFANKNHIDLSRRYLGWAVLAVFVIWMVFLNGLISAFRYHYGAMADDGLEATTAAFASALKDGVNFILLDPAFRDFMSFILFFFGIGLAIFAFYKGYHADDVYPGYGKLHREWASSRASWETRIESVRKDLHSLLESQRSALLNKKSELLQYSSQASQALTTLENAKTSCRGALQVIRNEYLQVRNSYRQINLTIRTTPPPTYFGDDSTELPQDYEGSLAEASALLGGLRGRLEEVKSRYLDRVARRLQQQVTEIAGLEKTLFASFEAEIKQRAEKEIAEQDYIIRKNV